MQTKSLLLSSTMAAYNVSCLVLIMLLFVINQTVDCRMSVNAKNNTQFIFDSLEIIYIRTNNERIQNEITIGVTSNIEESNGSAFISKSNLPIEELVLDAQNIGAAAVIYATPTYQVPGYLKYRWSNKDVLERIQIPIFELGLSDGKTFFSLYDSGDILNVTIEPSDSLNEWDAVLQNSGNYIWEVVFGLFCLVNIALAIWKMRAFVLYYGKLRTSMALYVLIIELISNLIRLVLSVDPLVANYIYPEPLSIALGELSFPFALASFMLFTLYWHEMMTKSSVVVHPFITKMRIPFFILSVTLLALQIIRILLRSFTTIGQLPLITAIAYLLVILGTTIFYIVTGIKILKRLNESKNLGRLVRLRRSTVKILISAGFLLSFIIFAILFVTGVAHYPISYLVVWYSLWSAINAASLMNILAFEAPSGRSSNHRSSSHQTAGTASLGNFERHSMRQGQIN